MKYYFYVWRAVPPAIASRGRVLVAATRGGKPRENSNYKFILYYRSQDSNLTVFSVYLLSLFFTTWSFYLVAYLVSISYMVFMLLVVYSLALYYSIRSIGVLLLSMAQNE